MRDTILKKIDQWQQSLKQLQTDRQRLASQLADLDVTIQRHIGAVAGAEDVLREEESSEGAEIPSALPETAHAGSNRAQN